jgi:hypothetical protein
MWHKAWAQSSQSGAGRLGFDVFSKSVFNMCRLKLARRVSNVGKVVLPQSLAAQPS